MVRVISPIDTGAAYPIGIDEDTCARYTFDRVLLYPYVFKPARAGKLARACRKINAGILIDISFRRTYVVRAHRFIRHVLGAIAFRQIVPDEIYVMYIVPAEYDVGSRARLRRIYIKAAERRRACQLQPADADIAAADLNAILFGREQRVGFVFRCAVNADQQRRFLFCRKRYDF